MKKYFLLIFVMIVSSITFSQTINSQFGDFERDTNPFDSTLIVTLQIKLNENESEVLGHAFNIKFQFNKLALKFIRGSFLNFNEVDGYETSKITSPGNSGTIQNIETKLISGLGRSVTDEYINFIEIEFRIIDFSYTPGLCPSSNSNGFQFRSPNSQTDWKIGEWICYEPITPVELTSFSATLNNIGNVMLNWTTATEINNQGFEIQRQYNNSGWEKISFIEGFGTTTEPRDYSFIDNVSKVDYELLSYRLKQIDYDGSYEMSKIINVENVVPQGYTLFQNYPNPFNPQTTIKFSVPEDDEIIELKVFNSLGEIVTLLVNEVMHSGSFKIQFDATELPSGIYFYQLKAGNYVETKKMVLIK